ncbi:type II CAAX endopeptidase family protein [Phenylobacterium sp.]|uniref:CPBP family intramembrane glutamic endopeptidase n=1 Tax=Phenylobacterium sp. TaxID=1871053 RepID=UPI00286D3A0C|nr:type II CAAX endopeptidase family protein [Phenylobacterium sp.]
MSRIQKGDVKLADRSPAEFLKLLVLLSIPFWIAGYVVDRYLASASPINLPFSALMAINPLIVAFYLARRESGRDASVRLLRSVFDWRKISPTVWLAPILLTMPLVSLGSYGLMQAAGAALPEPDFPWRLMPIFVPVFLLFAFAEEVGWQGYLMAPLQARWGALVGGVIVGLAWAVWHLIPYAQAGHGAGWIFWQCVTTVLSRVLIAWVCSNTGGSLLAAVLIHATINLCAFTFPNLGSHYDPYYASLALAVPVALVVIFWEPASLARRRRFRR